MAWSLQFLGNLRKNKDFVFLPVPILPGWLKILHFKNSYSWLYLQMSLFPSKLMRSIFRLICALNVFGKKVNIFIVKNRFKLKVQWKGCKVCMHNTWPNIQTADHPIINSNNPRGHPDCVILAWRPKKKGKGENDRLFMKFLLLSQIIVENLQKKR